MSASPSIEVTVHNSSNESNKLPDGWVKCRIEDVIRIQNGYAFSSKEFCDDGVPIIRQGNLAGDRISLTKCVHIDQSYLETKPNFVLKKGDMLIGMSGSIGKLCIYDLDRPAFQPLVTERDLKAAGRHLKKVR